MQFPHDIYPSVVDSDGSGTLTFGGVDVEEIAHDFLTPVMVYSAQDIRDETQLFVDAFDRVLFASKSCPIKGIERIIFEHGVGCDVSTNGELTVALQAGCDPQMIVMHGNNKSVEEIKHCIHVGVGRIVVEDAHECELIERIAGELGVTKVDVQLRVTPGVEAHTHEAIMTGAIDSKFGCAIDYGIAQDMLDRIIASDVLHLQGFHCHIGSQIFDTEPMAYAAKVVAEFYIQQRERLIEQGITLDINEINIGGGFGIKYEDSDNPPPTIEMAHAVKKAAHDVCAAHGFHDVEIWVEPGRALVGRAGVTLYRVGNVKIIPHTRRYISVDGGMSDNLRPAIYDAKHACWINGKNGDNGTDLFTVAGKHCEEGDRIATDVELPCDVDEGDLLIQASTGAYSFAMASNYNLVTKLPVVLVDDGVVTEIVRRETVDELLARQL